MADRGRSRETKLAIYDELLGHLEGILFQIPVQSFIDRHCLIFEPDVEDSSEYRKVWDQYKAMVSQLLEGFREDCGLSHEQIIQTLKQIDKEIDLQDKSVFEQVFATESYPVFVTMMARKNTELQQQVILAILIQTGNVPDIMIQGDIEEFKKKAATKSQPQPVKSEPSPVMSEDAILAAVLKKSKEEYEVQKARQREQDDAEVAKAIRLSKEEAPKLQQQHREQQQRLNEALRECVQQSSTPTKERNGSTSVKKMTETSSGMHAEYVDDEISCEAKHQKKTSVIADVRAIKTELQHLVGPCGLSDADLAELISQEQERQASVEVGSRVKKHIGKTQTDVESSGGPLTVLDLPQKVIEVELIEEPKISMYFPPLPTVGKVMLTAGHLEESDSEPNHQISTDLAERQQIPEPGSAPEKVLTARNPEAVQGLTLAEAKQSISKPSKKSADPTPVAQTQKMPLSKKPATKAPEIKMTNEQAAANWLAGAMKEVDEKSSVQKMAENYSKLSSEELKQRQSFLKAQRDKLLAMKQKEREKQLLSAEKSSGRPMSARAARSTLKDDGSSAMVDDKQLAMRKAIANRLKEEVIGKQ